MTKPDAKPPLLLSPFVQMIAGFVLPTIVLLWLSGEKYLGPAWAMVLALSFPVLLELYSMRVRRKPSLMSLFAIGGILLVGAISLLGLSEEWLAVRRSALYVIAAIALLIVVRFRPTLLERGLERVLDMPAARTAAREKATEKLLLKHTIKTGYMLAGFLLLIAAMAYAVTLVVITAPTGSSEFNAEYARLRVISIVAVTVPLIVGVTGLLLYLTNGFEKLTGIAAEELLKKK